MTVEAAPTAVKAVMPNGATVFYRDADHTYWRSYDFAKHRGSGQVRSSSGVAACDGDTNKDGLVDWGVRLAGQGLSWREERDRKGDIGQGAHDLLEALGNGKSVEPVSPQEQAVKAWWDSRQPQPLQVEQIVYSAEHDFAGRFDLFVARAVGTKQLWDLKTGSVYSKAAVQLNLYEIARREVGFDPADELWILKVTPRGRFYEIAVPIRPDWALGALATYGHGKEMRSHLAAAQKQAEAAWGAAA